MKYKVEMLAFGHGRIREVDVPDEKPGECRFSSLLEQIFHYGQNDFQPQDCPSVSVGDVIQIPKRAGRSMRRFRVEFVGFKELK